MYFPILRGKQNELIAIRDLVQQGVISEQIVPVVEPIKYSPTLISTIEQFIELQRELVVIVNPDVGAFIDDLNENAEYVIRIRELLHNPSITIGYHLHGNSVEDLEAFTEAFGISLEQVAIIHKDISNLSVYDTLYNEVIPRYNFIPSSTEFRVRFTNQNAVLLTDPFVKRDRNVDYADIDEPFSSEHRFYEQQGFIGFSDYSIVGSDYIESGFGAMAVAIHIVYLDNQNNLRIRHFVSDSNEDRTDPGGKFSEALVKVVTWYNDTDDERLNTSGLATLLNYDETGTSTSLGVVKRLSIMHHLEIINGILVPALR
ncbi:sce7725 family protein [Lysinibacillus fusiformis]|uniref:sce7725 family protein n=1 Tax=Lysinibacillus fusiformis TaxID=28031 RepID=UPI0011A770DB|nr:sce7725 family protein [Lysinibacillus fusiformis]